MNYRSRLQKSVFRIIAADFPLLYIWAVSWEETSLTIAAVVIMALAAIGASLVF